jgi:hypothetical protein
MKPNLEDRDGIIEESFQRILSGDLGYTAGPLTSL